jgi:hypothetical protein
MTTTEPSPYKFLDPFEPEDRDRFFGRDREIKVLLSDIVTTRLVVLFAKTGTGKTSLINAGVRPLLHERGYVTFFIRVDDDPVRSASKVIGDDLQREPTARRIRTGIGLEAVASLNGAAGFADALTALARDLAPKGAAEARPTEAGDDEPEPRVPLVLFFDQFEEFFLTSARENPAGARDFVAQVAELYEDGDSGVHLVFSMREEFLAEMDLFRDDIPEIFHADSNLRLRWFTPEQAKAAITGPVGGAIEPDLATLLLQELADLGRTDTGVNPETPIEPAQLQIVCDTIWRDGGGAPLALETYDRLGRAAAILDRRLVEELGNLGSKENVDLVWQLLPELTTERGTKAVREVADLARALGSDEDTLLALFRELERSGLVNLVSHDSTHLVELVHDYLADPKRVETLRRSLRLVRPRRALADALAGKRLLTRAELGEALEALDELAPTAEEGALLFRSSVRAGLSGFDATRVLRHAEAAGAPVWPILQEALAGGDEEGAVEAVAGLASPEALALLQAALARPRVAARAIELIGEFEAPEAADILGSRLGDPELAHAAETALVRLSRSRAPGDAPARAARHLESFFRNRPSSTERVVEYEGRPSTFTNEPTDSAYNHIVRELLEGSVVVFLGNEIARFARPRDVQWQRVRFLPTGSELAEHLAEVFFYPAERAGDLPRVAQYVKLKEGSAPLYRELRKIFADDYPPTRLHELLARLPGLSRSLGDERYNLIVTTSYDDALERAFDAAAEPYDVVWYVADHYAYRGKLLHRPYGGSPVVITRPNTYDALSPDERTVILKVHGSVDREDPEHDSFVITEDHFIDYLTTADIDRLLPPFLLSRLHRSSWLFLGFNLVDWIQRVVLHRIWRDQALSYASWAVREDCGQIERVHWDHRNIEVLTAPLEQFVTELARRVDEFARSG